MDIEYIQIEPINDWAIKMAQMVLANPTSEQFW